MLMEIDNAASQYFQKYDFAKAEEYNNDALLLLKQVSLYLGGIVSDPCQLRFSRTATHSIHISKLTKRELEIIFNLPRPTESNNKTSLLSITNSKKSFSKPNSKKKLILAPKLNYLHSTSLILS
jgi:hypothetical protein